MNENSINFFAKPILSNGHYSYNLLKIHNDEEYVAGVSLYVNDTYSEPGKHNFQEGFYVLEGSGYAKIGEQEFKIEPNMAFWAPPQVNHSIKCDASSKQVRVFWFHIRLNKDL